MLLHKLHLLGTNREGAMENKMLLSPANIILANAGHLRMTTPLQSHMQAMPFACSTRFMLTQPFMCCTDFLPSKFGVHNVMHNAVFPYCTLARYNLEQPPTCHFLSVTSLSAVHKLKTQLGQVGDAHHNTRQLPATSRAKQQAYSFHQ